MNAILKGHNTNESLARGFLVSAILLNCAEKEGLPPLRSGDPRGGLKTNGCPFATLTNIFVFAEKEGLAALIPE